MPENLRNDPPFGWHSATWLETGEHPAGDDDSDRAALDKMLERRRALRAFEEETRFSRLRSWLIHIVSWCILFLGVAACCVFAWHALLPASWRWLAPEELVRLERVIISILSGVISTGAVYWLFQKR